MELISYLIVVRIPDRLSYSLYYNRVAPGFVITTGGLVNLADSYTDGISSWLRLGYMPQSP